MFTKTQQRVLGLLYARPDQSFYTNEIVRWADMGRGTVRRELDRLVSAGLLVQRRKGNQLHYQANSACPIFDELVSIVRKTFGILDLIKAAILPLVDRIDVAFIYGSIARGAETSDSDVDLMLISDSLSYSEVVGVLADAEQSLGRSINPTLYSADQVKDKLQQKNAFLSRVMEQPRLWVKGDENDIRVFG